MKEQSRIFDGGGGSVHTQYAALCWRASGGMLEVLLITSRETGRWVVPKGWPIKGRAPHEVAAREAWEEAGVIGSADPNCLGLFGYRKAMGSDEPDRAVLAAVYPVAVGRLAEKFPEAGQRKRCWFAPEQAAGLVAEPDLAAVIAAFRPTSGQDAT
ncbi:MAG: NUDIX hydrolase [Gemmobacter sp.]